MSKQFLFLISFLLFIFCKTFAQDDTSLHEENHDHEHREENQSEDTIRNEVIFFKTYSDNLDTFRIDVDTFLHQIHNYNAMYKESFSTINLGNYGSPYISNLYFERPKVDFLFSDVYHAFYNNKKNVANINTKKPYTVLNYNNGGPKYFNEESLSALFSVNIRPEFNFGAYFDIIFARGRYSDQASRNKNIGFFTSYTKSKYSAFFNIGTSSMENYENGGFGNSEAWADTILTKPQEGINGKPENLQVRLQDESARSYARNRYISLEQKYNIGVNREVQGADSATTEFIPALNLIHQFEMDADIKQYNDKVGMSYFYDTAYIHSGLTTDSVRKRDIRNCLGIYLDERINRFGKFGLGTYIQIDNDYITQASWSHIADSSLSKNYSALMTDYKNKDITLDSTRLDFIQNCDGYKYTNLSIGGSIFKRYGTHFFFDAEGKVYLSGYNSGDWQVKGNLRQVFPKMRSWEINVRANFESKTPDYFLQHYYSNNYWWDNNFKSTFHQSIGGTIKIPSINFSFSADIDNMQNHVYLNKYALPQQYDKNMAVLALHLKKNFEFGKHVVWENNIVYQQTSAPKVIPLPMLTAYTNIYFRHILFKVLHFEIGAEARYHTSYKAPGYMPSSGRFYNQDDVEIGNYPLINVYADFFLRRMRFFVMGQHINKGWPTSNAYFSAPHYAFNPRQLKFGLQWTFYD